MARESPNGEEHSHASSARDLTRGTGKAVPRGPGLDSTPDRTLRITRNQDSIAEFQSEYYQYWEYIEETSAGTGEDTQIDTSVSG
jgi:hypothetical protein